MISSLNNPRIKSLRLLRDKKKARRDQGVFMVEGAREVERALAAQFICDQLIYCPNNLSDGIKDLLGRTSPLQGHLEVSQEVFDSLAVREEAAQLLATFKTPSYSLAEIKLRGEAPIILIVENLEKPGNLGALLRSADGANVDAILLTESSVEVFNPNVIRASLGTVFNVPAIACSNKDALNYCRDHQIRCLAAAPGAKKVYHQENLVQATAFILGNEALGLSDFWLKNSVPISIPMNGIADSLNVSISGALLAYEALRQRS